ncbi:hypothetical protein SAMN04487977_101466 [Treponema bryantii]|uniref:Uncharacterized protein n=1 Tax=Treponema bryantii TaxID=163 RepID=A0A1H9ATX9_9SPIR|nr:phage tail terminator-like protein [Treponema bryantii]SEP80099.1 hypothetical protein SAMN04487977_101466 [Treponema bryantii]
MTELDIQEKLFDHFKTLNAFSGIEYLVLKNDNSGDYENVHFPNGVFSEPEDKRWFDLTFLSNEPSDSSIVAIGGSQYRFTGVMYVDIYSPEDVKEYEVSEKYRWIAKLFNDAEIEYVDIMRVYISTKGSVGDSYRLQVAIDWEADIDKE